MTSVINCDYNRKIVLVEKILVVIYILEIFPKSRLNMQMPFSHMPKNKGIWFNYSCYKKKYDAFC
jgi:hypothetical protein